MIDTDENGTILDQDEGESGQTEAQIETLSTEATTKSKGNDQIQGTRKRTRSLTSLPGGTSMQKKGR